MEKFLSNSEDLEAEMDQKLADLDPGDLEGELKEELEQMEVETKTSKDSSSVDAPIEEREKMHSNLADLDKEMGQKLAALGLGDLEELKEELGQMENEDSSGEDAPTEESKQDPYGRLEEVLKEAFDMHCTKAQELKAEDTRAAGTEARKAMSFKKQLEKLQLARQEGRALPDFRWNISYQEQVKTRKDLSDSELEVKIHGIEGTFVKRCYYFFSYSIPIPKKDNPAFGYSKSMWFEEDELDVQFSVKLPLIERKKRSTNLAFNNRKITLEIYRWHWFFRPTKLIGKVQVLLKDLIDNCEITQTVLVFDTRTKKTVNTRKVKVSLALQKPLDPNKVQMETVEIRELQIDPWPDSTSVESNKSDENVPEITEEEQMASLTQSMNELEGTQEFAEALINRPVISKQSSQRLKPCQEEIDDPFNPEFMVSNDVLESEIQKIAEKYGAGELPVDDLVRKTTLENRLDMLTASVQSGQLSLEAYMHQLETRVQRDKMLALHLSQIGRKADAVAVLKRSKIMEAEIASAEGVAEESKEGDEKKDEEIAILHMHGIDAEKMEQPQPSLELQTSNKMESQIPPPPPKENSTEERKVALVHGVQASHSSNSNGKPPQDETDDPFSIDLLVSNDVLDAEIQSINAKYKNRELPVDLLMRRTQLQMALDALVKAVQDESLSLEAYVERLKDRVSKDKVLAVHLNKKDRKEDAVAVLKRIKIMVNEIRGVEQAEPDSS